MRLFILQDAFLDELIVSFIILIASWILAKITHSFVYHYLMRLAEKTKTKLDDMIIEAIKSPIYLLVLFIGAYFGIMNLSAFTSQISLIKGIFWVIFAITLTWVVKRVVSIILDWYADEIAHKTKSDIHVTMFPLMRKIVSVLIWVIMFIMILDHFNIEISPLIASLGVASLAVALALQETLSNFFAGMYIIADQPIRVGDYMKLEGGEEGFVEKIGWRSTRIRKLGHNMVIIPNSSLASATIINYDLPEPQMSVVTYCGVDYGSDLDKVEKVALDAAISTRDSFEGAFKDYEPKIRFYEFGDSNINFKIIMRAKTYVDKFALQHQLVKNLKKAFDKHKIEISWPVRKNFYMNPHGK